MLDSLVKRSVIIGLKGGILMKYETPILETDRLILKRGTYEDLVKVYEYDFTYLRNIDGEFKFVKFDPEKLKGWENIGDNDYTLDFILYLRDTMEPIGNLVIDRYDSSNNSLEIACNLHPNYWRQGFMGEAILKVMDYVFTNLGIDNIRYSYAEENFKSKGLSDKIGFKFLKKYEMHYKIMDKDVKHIETIMSKERFYELYSNFKKK